MGDQLRVGFLGANSDAQFVADALAGNAATPDFADAVDAHRIIDAMYASAAGDSASVEVQVAVADA